MYRYTMCNMHNNREAAANVRHGHGQIVCNGKVYQAVKPVRGNTLKAGMLLLATYNQFNTGADLVEVLGFTDTDVAYGEGGVVFKDVKDVFKKEGVSSLKALEIKQNLNEYGHHTYMVVRDVDGGDSGARYYLFEGRWSRGSGAEALSFTLMEEV